MDNREILSKLDRVIPGLVVVFAAFSVISIAGTQISIGLILFFSILKMTIARRWDIPKTPIDPAFVLFTAACILSTIFSLHPVESLTHLKNLLLILVIYLVGANLKSRNQIHRVIGVLVLTATVMAALGLLTTDIFGGRRVRALQSTTMTWGALSAVFTLITASLFLFGERNRNRWLYLAAFAIQFVSMVFSYVRGAWLGFVAGILVLAVMKSKKLFFAGLALILIAFFLAPPLVRERMLSITDLSVNSTQVRLTQWRNAVSIVKDYPLLGVGWIDLGELHRQYAPPGADLSYHAYRIGHFHNNYIMFIVCFGFVGFAAACFFILRLFQTLVRIYRRIPDEDRLLSAFVVGALASMTAFWVNGFFDWTFGDAEPVTLLWLIVGLCIAIGSVIQNSKSRG